MSSWLADGVRPWPAYSPPMGEVVGVVVWRPKAVDSDELESMLSTGEYWLSECGYRLVALPTTWKRRRRAQSFDDWWREMVQQWAEDKRKERDYE